LWRACLVSLGLAVVGEVLLKAVIAFSEPMHSTHGFIMLHLPQFPPVLLVANSSAPPQPSNTHTTQNAKRQQQISNKQTHSSLAELCGLADLSGSLCRRYRSSSDRLASAGEHSKQKIVLRVTDLMNVTIHRIVTCRTVG
jgi:hypothetical protein